MPITFKFLIVTCCRLWSGTFSLKIWVCAELYPLLDQAFWTWTFQTSCHRKRCWLWSGIRIQCRIAVLLADLLVCRCTGCLDKGNRPCKKVEHAASFGDACLLTNCPPPIQAGFLLRRSTLSVSAGPCQIWDWVLCWPMFRDAAHLGQILNHFFYEISSATVWRIPWCSGFGCFWVRSSLPRLVLGAFTHHQ